MAPLESLRHLNRIGVISDIHSNYVALQAVLDEMARRQVDALIFLGDYITDGPDPQRTLALLREAAQQYPSFFIRGNREQYLIDHADRPHEVWQSGSSQGALLYTYQRLTAQDIRWFRSMPMCHSFDEGVVICHGSPGRINELLNVDGSNSVTSDSTWQWLDTMTCPLLVCGHTHRQGLSLWPRQIIANEDWPQKTILNAGSVGLPHNHDSLARAALLHRDDNGWQPELLSIPYDTDAILKAYYESELMEMAPFWSLANCRFLTTGHNYILRLIRHTKSCALRLGLPQDAAIGSLLDLPREAWEMAAKEIGLI